LPLPVIVWVWLMLPYTKRPIYLPVTFRNPAIYKQAIKLHQTIALLTQTENN